MTTSKLEKFLSTNTKTFLAVTCCILFAYILCRKPKVVYNTTKDPAELQALQQYRDENGKLYIKLNQQEQEKARYKEHLDSLGKLLKIKPKYIKGEEVLVVQTDTEFVKLPSKVIVVGKDTMYKVERHDPWVDVTAIAGPAQGSITLKVKDTFTRLETVKNPLFGPTKRTIYILNKNPYSRASEGSSFVIKEKQTWLTIGPYVGYDPFRRGISAGISIQVPIIKLKR